MTGKPDRPFTCHRRTRQLPARPGHGRQGGEAPDLTPPGNPPGGAFRWPPVGRNHGRQWGEKLAANGEKQMAVDTAALRNRQRHKAGVTSRFVSDVLFASCATDPAAGAHQGECSLREPCSYA